MSDDDAVERRLRAVERALTDDDRAVADLAEAGELADRVDALESDLEDLRDRVAELESATQALRGYVGNVRSVNRDVEQRADAAVAAVDRLEDRLDDRFDDATDGAAADRVAPGTRGRGHPDDRTPDSPPRGRGGRCEQCGRSRHESRERSGTDDPPSGDTPAGEWSKGADRSADPADGSSVLERVRDAL